MVRETFIRLVKRIGIVLGIYLIIGFIYVICIQFTKIKSYEMGTNTENKIKLAISYNNASINEANIDNDSLTNFISCYQKPITKEEFTIDMNNKYNEIEELFKSSDERVSFSYEDLYSGLHISYNENQTYFAASVIKNPVIIYVYKLYTEGKIDFNTMLTYSSGYYVAGSGYIQYQPVGSTYTIKELTRRAIIDSDNIAYVMLAYYVNEGDIRKYWENLGADYFWSGSVWGSINSHDSTIYMKELYRFTNENPQIKEELLSYYFKSVAKLISLNDNNIKIAHKSGWNSATIHDSAIVYDEQPYILAITSLKGYSNYSDFFKKTSILVNDFHKLYWNQKIKYCYNEIFSNNKS